MYKSVDEFLALTGAAAPTGAERALIGHCRAGTRCILSDTLPTAPTEANTIRAPLLRLLITGGTENCGLHERGVLLEGARVTEELNLGHCTARGQTVLTRCYFDQAVNLRKAHLADVSFMGSRFVEIAGDHLVVETNLNLTKALLEKTLSFQGADIRGMLDCSGICLGPAPSGFKGRRMRVRQGLVLRDMEARSSVVDLTAAEVSELVDERAAWPAGQNALRLDGLTYGRIGSDAPATLVARKAWLRAGSVWKGNFLPQPYTQFARTLRAMGHEGEARKVMIEANVQRTKHERRVLWQGSPWCRLKAVWNKLRNGILRWSIGFGYEPQRSVWWLLLLIGLAAFLAQATWREGSFAPNSDVILTSPGWSEIAARGCVAGELPGCIANPAAEWSGRNAPGMDWDSFNALAYGLDLVLPLVDLGQTQAWAPSKDRGWLGCLMWWGRWFFILAGWVVASLGLAAVTGFVQKNAPE